MALKNKCQSCERPFETADFTSYLIRERSYNVPCQWCREPNYFVREDAPGFQVAHILSGMTGITVFWLFSQLLWSFLTTQFFAGRAGLMVGFIIFITGFFCGLKTYRLLIKLYVWNKAPLTNDREYKYDAEPD